jgi:ligand-binding sensor domain-containing protein
MFFDGYRSQLFALIRRNRRKLFGLALAILFPIGAIAELLPVKTYTVADGALRDAVTRIRQDSRGFLWLCSAEGISRFDGYTFTNFTTADGLPDRHVNDFLESRSGNYWVATDAGLARLNPGGVRTSVGDPVFTVFLPPNPESKRINVLYQDDGAISRRSICI